VADSDPAREYEETLHKATGLLRSLQKLQPESDD
jgi:anthranilate/para-aminobenzoate synthase component I